MRPLATTDFMDYRRKVEIKGINNHRNYINEQMSQARDATDDARRSQCLANVIAANGLMLRSMDVGFVTGDLNYKAIQEISAGIENTQAFRSLMADGSGERLAKNGSVDALVRDLQERDRELAEKEPPSRPAIDVIRGVQAKVRARTAQPRDYAALVAAYRLSSMEGKWRAPDGKLIDTVRHDVTRQLDGKMLGEETDRVMLDPDFQYLMGHEKQESLYINALRANGMAFQQYPQRVEKLRTLEAERSKSGQREAEQTEPIAPQKNEQGPVR